MESTQAKVRTRTVVFGKVSKVYENKTKVWQKGIGSEAAFEEKGQGWFMHIEGSWEAIYLGKDQPDFAAGDRVKITFEKVS